MRELSQPLAKPLEANQADLEVSERRRAAMGDPNGNRRDRRLAAKRMRQIARRLQREDAAK